MAFDVPPKPTFSQVQQAASSAVKPFYKVADETGKWDDLVTQKRERDKQTNEIEQATANKGNVGTNQRR